MYYEILGQNAYVLIDTSERYPASGSVVTSEWSFAESRWGQFTEGCEEQKLTTTVILTDIIILFYREKFLIVKSSSFGLWSM